MDQSAESSLDQRPTFKHKVTANFVMWLLASAAMHVMTKGAVGGAAFVTSRLSISTVLASLAATLVSVGAVLSVRALAARKAGMPHATPKSPWATAWFDQTVSILTNLGSIFAVLAIYIHCGEPWTGLLCLAATSFLYLFAWRLS